LAKYFGIAVDENNLHEAKYDTELTLKVFLALREKIMAVPVAIG